MGLQRFVVYGLRHNPKELGVELDSEGYCPVDALLGSLGITRDRLMEIIRQSDNRLALSDDGTRIRAAHGHSVDVAMKMGDVPPDILYHGTSEEASHSISKNGIHRMGRSYVHLSEDIETACRVGGRHSNGAPVVSVMESDDPIDLVDLGVGVDANGTRHVIPKEMLRDLYLFKGEKAFGGVWTESGMDFVLQAFDNGEFKLIHESV